MRRPLDCYAVCPPGVEELTAAELAALGIRPGRADRGGVAFRATNRQLYAANLWLRTATRVLVRLASFGASSFGALEQRADEIAWPTWLAPGAVAGFRVTATASKLYHTDAIAERLARAADAAADGPGPRRRANERPEPTQLFVVRARNDRFTVSVDASGVPLYKRGWRQEVARAPLRESLAAALLLALGWEGSRPLVDPFCGSGTIPIEAALLARNLPPGYQRDFAFFDWPSFEPGTWASVIGAAAEAERDVEVPIVGADRDAGAVEAARANAERAGVADEVELRHASISDLVPPAGAAPGWLVTNPPYGERLAAAGDLRNLYARLGTVVRARFAGWHVGLLVADRRLAAHTGLHLGPVLQADNGGIPTELVADRSAAGALRRPADH